MYSGTSSRACYNLPTCVTFNIKLPPAAAAAAIQFYWPILPKGFLKRYTSIYGIPEIFCVLAPYFFQPTNNAKDKSERAHGNGELTTTLAFLYRGTCV